MGLHVSEGRGEANSVSTLCLINRVLNFSSHTTTKPLGGFFISSLGLCFVVFFFFRHNLFIKCSEIETSGPTCVSESQATPQPKKIFVYASSSYLKKRQLQKEKGYSFKCLIQLCGPSLAIEGVHLKDGLGHVRFS